MALGIYNSNAFKNASGIQVVAQANIEVRRENDGGLASIFSDRAGTSGITQVAYPGTSGFKADSLGYFEFYAAGVQDGYKVRIYSDDLTLDKTVRYQPVGTGKEFDINEFWRTIFATATQAAARLALGFAAIAAKGDSWWGSAADTLVKLAAGANGTSLVADSGETAGARWADLPFSPGGRLSLTTAVPVTVADVSGATTVYYIPYKHNVIKLYDGSGWVPKVFAELSQATTDTTKSPAAVAPESCYDIFVWNDAGTLRATRGPAWTYAATVTMTIASPCVVTWNAHGLYEGQPIVFTTTGALPTGLAAGTTYYVRNPATNTFNVASTPGGTVINTSGTQSGAHTATNRDKERGTGAGTTELEQFEGRYVNKNAITNGPTARRGLYVGTIRSTSASQIEDSKAKRYVWNNYNRVPRAMAALDTTNTWNYTTATYRQANGSTANQLDFVRGLNEDSLSAWATSLASNSLDAGTGLCAIGLDSTTTKAADSTSGVGHLTNTGQAQMDARYLGMPDIGRHYLSWLEYSPGSGTTTWTGDGGSGLSQAGIQGEMSA